MFSLFLTQYDGMFLGPIAKILGLVLNGIFEFLNLFGVQNAAISLILLTFVVNAFMIPFTIKQQKFSKLSSVMNPEIMKVQEKYKNKKDEESLRKQQLEQQAIYQKYGASPVSGCLPLLITFPILLALWRVISNIPAYVDDIYQLYAVIAEAIQGTNGYVDIMLEYAKNLNVATSKWAEINEATRSISSNHMVDILSKFTTADWDSLKTTFPALTGIITENSAQILKINSFIGGLNIADAPGLKFPGILIPILSTLSQWFQTRQISASTPTDTSNPSAGMMKSMNTVMPIMSGVMCITFPIGLGLYWVAGSVFRIIQQFFVNRYMKSIDVQQLIDKNVEKANKKKIRKGIDPNASMTEYTKKNTKSISDNASNVGTTASYANKKLNTVPSDYKKSDASYKAGSISANANLLRNRNSSDKGEK